MIDEMVQASRVCSTTYLPGDGSRKVDARRPSYSGETTASDAGAASRHCMGKLENLKSQQIKQGRAHAARQEPYRASLEILSSPKISHKQSD